MDAIYHDAEAMKLKRHIIDRFARSATASTMPPEANELAEMARDARRYAARRLKVFETRLRLQVGGPRPSWEEFCAEYDAACDKEAGTVIKAVPDRNTNK